MNTSPLEVAPEDANGPGQSQVPPSGATVWRWRHAFGEMLIETGPDGSVWIDGKRVDVQTAKSALAAAPKGSQA